ncbi:unnamed protein product [Linum tenue]|uniref:Uncharacterized protein n=1 Tax=Linum tenue TaxID=586396 RepID=A0AAV0LQZ0_9ROSI|nr:unnamed protein product [Linum tenue]
MDVYQRILNIALPPLVWLTVFVMLPWLFAFRAFHFVVKRTLWYENVSGKVVVITGASSGIGEHLTYEYARRRARLAIAARREDRLQCVAAKARQLGSPDVIFIRTDVSKFEDCRKLIQETVDHFGRLDHLVNNAGITKLSWFEDCTPVSEFQNLMNINFWGAAYCTQFAVPHLRRTRGKIVAISSVSGRMASPKMGFYSASKSAMISLFEGLRVEVGSEIGITIVTPGLITSEMTEAEEVQAEPFVKFIPPETPGTCAKAIVNGVCRGDRYLTEPSWMRMFYLLKFACPEVMELCNQLIIANLNGKKVA